MTHQSKSSGSNQFVQKLGQSPTDLPQLGKQISVQSADTLEDKSAKGKRSYHKMNSVEISANLKQLSQNEMQGFVIDEEAPERQVFVQCPMCKLDVFDSGLSNELKCLKCNYMFDPERKGEGSNSDSGGGIPNTSSPTHDREFFKYDTEEVKNSGKQSEEFQNINYGSDSEEELLQEISHRQDKKIEGQSSGIFSTNGFFKKIVDTMKVDALKKQESSSSKDEQKIDNMSTQEFQELESVLLFVVKETIMEDFLLDPPKKQTKKDFKEESKETTAFSDSAEPEQEQIPEVIKEARINFHLLLNSLLMPFFQLKTRILERGNFFKIGDIEFYVAATTHGNQGKVTAKSVVRCSAAVSKQETLARVNLVPLQSIVSSRALLMQNILKPYFTSHIGICLHKDQVLQIGNSQKFLVRYARPYFGIINQGTEVKIDQLPPKKLQRIRIAPIWETQADYQQASQDGKQVTTQMLQEQILVPYYQNSGLTCFLEKGETLRIASREFFVNDCWPRQGIVNASTQIEVEFGFTREVFNRKQVQADERLAERLQGQVPDQSTQFRPSLSAEQFFEPGIGNVHWPGSDSDEDEGHAQLSSIPAGLQQRLRSGYDAGHQGASMRELLNMLAEVEDLRQGQPQENAQGSDEEHKTANNAELGVTQPSEDETDSDQDNTGQQSSTQDQGALQRSRIEAEDNLTHNIHDILRELLQRQGQNPFQQRVAQLRHQQDIFRGGSSEKVTPKAILDSLPVRVITEPELARILVQNSEQTDDEGNTKCLVCLTEYEADQEVRTMPCLHYFHRECIDKWLLKRASTCPICKFNIKKDYNCTSSEQISSNQEQEFQSYNPDDFDF